MGRGTTRQASSLVLGGTRLPVFSSGLLDHGASLRAEQNGGEGAQHLSLQEKDSWDSSSGSSSGGAGSLYTPPHRVAQPSPLPGPGPDLTRT